MKVICHTQWGDSDMSFAIVTILLTLLAGIVGSRLANHYSVYALVPVTFFFLALAAAGCVAYGATLFGSALTALSGVIGNSAICFDCSSHGKRCFDPAFLFWV